MKECIIWDGLKRKDKRGYIRINNKIIDSNRYVYENTYGKIPEGICVRRKCKNIECININHLYLEPKIIPAKERFFKFVKIPIDKKLCWIWLGNKDKDGYGKFNALKDFNERSAHRVSYIIHKGKISKNKVICHSCDNPSCVNPEHLWIGSISDNTKDSFLKNRRNSVPPIHYGKDNHKTKLTEFQVIEIRDLYYEGFNYAELSRIYPVSAHTIREICLRKIWKWI
jgi:hypothetical protein